MQCCQRPSVGTDHKFRSRDNTSASCNMRTSLLADGPQLPERLPLRTSIGVSNGLPKRPGRRGRPHDTAPLPTVCGRSRNVLQFAQARRLCHCVNKVAGARAVTVEVLVAVAAVKPDHQQQQTAHSKQLAAPELGQRRAPRHAIRQRLYRMAVEAVPSLTKIDARVPWLGQRGGWKECAMLRRETYINHCREVLAVSPLEKPRETNGSWNLGHDLMLCRCQCQTRPPPQRNAAHLTVRSSELASTAALANNQSASAASIPSRS